MNREPDVEALITYLPTAAGGRKNPALSGYRPAHRVRADYLTTGEQHFLDRESVAPGQSVRAHITFVTPEVYPHCLWPGKVIDIQEGSRLVGHAKVLQVLNPLLLGVPATDQ